MSGMSPTHPKNIETRLSHLRRLTQPFLSWGLGLLVIALLGYYLYRNREKLAQATAAPPGIFFILTGLIVGTMLARAWQLRLMLGSMGTHIPIRRALTLTLSSQVLNCLPLRPGTLAQAVALKKENSFKYATYAALFLGQILVIFLGAGILGIVALLASGRLLAPESRLILTMLATGIAVPLLVFHIPRAFTVARRTWVQRALGDFFAGLRRLRDNRAQFAIVLAVTLIKLFLTALRLRVAAIPFGIDVTFVSCVVLACITQVSFLVSFTPGGVGIRQFLTASVALVVGLRFDDGLLLSSLDHAVAIILTFALGVPAVLQLLRGKRSKEAILLNGQASNV